MASCYTAIGIATAYLGTTMQIFLQTPCVLILTSCLLAVFALLQLEILPPAISHKLSAKLHLTNNIQSSGTILGVITMGIATALTLTPCATPALIGILIYISQTGDPWLGGATLFCLSIGMGIPLLSIAIIGHHILPKAGHWLNSIKHAMGLTLFGMIIWLLSRIFPTNVISLLWICLMLGIVWYLGDLQLSLPKTIWQWGKRLFSYGLLLGVISLSLITLKNYNLSWFSNKHLINEQNNNTSIDYTFKTINNLTELTSEFIKSKNIGKPIVLFFHADWCTYCKKLAANFQALHTQKYLQQFTTLQIDVTTQTEDEINMMEHYKVLGLPAVLFFATDGTEREGARLSEALEINELKQYMDEVLGLGSCMK
jgi:thiol:disulfide interchange protein DsbD